MLIRYALGQHRYFGERISVPLLVFCFHRTIPKRS
jgi:hypothetical protein